MRMTGGEAVVRSLQAHGVDAIFGIPGIHNLAVYDALIDSGIRHIVARHEQGAAFMADGYARASGRVGVCLCTSGPAALNTATSLGTAYCDSSPLLCIASQIPSQAIGKEKGYFHECRDQLGCLRPVTAWCERADTIASIPGVMREAFLRMQDGRPRPVAVEIPCDILDGSDETSIPEPAAVRRLQPPQEQIEEAIQLLRRSRRPVIWAGGGVISSGGSDQLRQLAERIQAPVFTTVLGKGSIPGDHPLSAGSALVASQAREYLATCDAMLAVGTRFTEEESLGWSIPMPESLIHIEVDPEEIGRNYAPTVAVVGDARESLRLLNEGLGSDQPRESSDRGAEVARLQREILRDCSEMAPEGVELVRALRAALPRETVIVSDLTLAAYWCRRLLDLYEPRTSIYPAGFATLGFGVPAAIGAKVACPQRPVVVLSGDGGFMFNCQELSIAAQFDIPIVVLVFNNQAFGVMKPYQLAQYGRTIAMDLENPDFVALTQAFGLNGRRVATLGELGPAVTDAVSSGRSCVIEVTADVPLSIVEPGPRSLFEKLQEKKADLLTS